MLIWYVLGIIAALVLVAVVVKAVVEYRKEPSDTRILTAFEDSATIALAEVTKLGGSLVYLLTTYGDALTDPTAQALMASIGVPTKVCSVLFALLGFLISACRRRTL